MRITALGFSLLCPHLKSNGRSTEREGGKSIVCFPDLVGITVTLMRDLSPSQSFGSCGLFVVSDITAMRLLVGW